MDSDIATARRLTLGMNVALVVALVAVVAGVVLDSSILVLATLGLFAVAFLGYVVGHVALHRRIATAQPRAVANDGTVVAALGLIRTNLLLYGGFIALAIGLAVTEGYLL
ncbi:hypothetical protein [Halomarina ordinaria]|uniref:Uncharacterized protein n=1 Tax=Halomarina ordinaria TaxID=3033939 RepID=A0ABD5UFX7_9EURY|nr:hypothetical protein [Halomarina sp. PSRA2]